MNLVLEVLSSCAVSALQSWLPPAVGTTLTLQVPFVATVVTAFRTPERRISRILTKRRLKGTAGA